MKQEAPWGEWAAALLEDLLAEDALKRVARSNKTYEECWWDSVREFNGTSKHPVDRYNLSFTLSGEAPWPMTK